MQRQCAGADGIRCPWGARARRGDRLCVGCGAILAQARGMGRPLHAVAAPGHAVSAAVEVIDARTSGPGPLHVSVSGTEGVRLIHRALRELITALDGRTQVLMGEIERSGEPAGEEARLRQAARRAQVALNEADLAALRTLDAQTGLLPWE